MDYYSSEEDILGVIADIYEDHHISEFGFDIIDLCKKMNINVIPYSSYESAEAIKMLIKTDEDGFSIFNTKNNKCEIYYNDFINPPERTRFTIPHELGHIELRHVLSEKQESYFNSYADRFSRQFYMPEVLLIYFNITDVNSLMSTFGITYQYACVICNRINKRIKQKKEFSKNEVRILNAFLKNKNA